MVVIQLIVMIYTLFGLEPDNILNFLAAQSKRAFSSTPSQGAHLRGVTNENNEEGDKEKSQDATHRKQMPCSNSMTRKLWEELEG